MSLRELTPVDLDCFDINTYSHEVFICYVVTVSQFHRYATSHNAPIGKLLIDPE